MDKMAMFAALLVAFLGGMAYMATLPGTRREKAGEREKKPKKIAFSKLIAAGVLAVDGYATYRVLALCELAIRSDFSGALPYLTALIGALQAATAYILGHYYKKSTAENTAGGITYDTALSGNPEPEPSTLEPEI